MKSKRLMGIIAVAVCAVMAFSCQAFSDARDDVVAHAYEILNWTWNTQGYIVLHYSGYEPDAYSTPALFSSHRPIVATGTLKGIPYTLSANGNGAEKSFSEYKALSDYDKRLVSNVYSYGTNSNGTTSYRVGMKYGMSCATFVWDCLSHGLSGLQRTAYSPSIPTLWGSYLTRTSYSALQKGDILWKSTHVMLVVSNNPSAGTVTVVEQTPPDIGSTRYLGSIYLPPHGYYAADVFDTYTVGTREKTYTYSGASSYTPYSVNYGSSYEHPLNNKTVYAYTLTSGRYSVYSDPNLTTKLSSSAWTGEDDEDWILGVDKNSSGVEYARISYPTSSSRITAYVSLKEVFVPGPVDSEAKTAKNSKYGLYIRRASGLNSSYGIDAGDTCYLLTEDNGWCQVLYPTYSSHWRIAWMTKTDYDYVFPSKKPVITDVPNIGLIAELDASYQCKAVGSGLTWSVSGSLPPGMSINSSTGEISGIPSSTSQGKASYNAIRYSFKVTAENSAGSDTKSAYIAVYEPPVITTDTTLPNGKLNSYYSKEFYAEGTERGMSWKVKSGTLPPGMTFTWSKNFRNPKIAGTPTQSGTYQFTLELKNSSTVTVTKTFTLTIDGSIPEANMWIEGNFKNGTVGEYYYSNAVSLYFRYLVYLSRWKLRGSNVSVVSGSLPPGLNLSWASSVTWIDSKGTSAAIYLIGTPTTAGTYTFTIRAQNGMGGYTDSEQTVTISQPSRPFADSSMSIRYTFVKGKLGVSYNDYVAVWGGTSPYTVTKTLGIMPPGLDIQTNGRYTYLRGLPTRYGTYTFTLRATGAHNGYVDKEFTMTIANNSSYLRAGVGEEDEDNPTKPKLATKKIPEAAAYSEYSVTFEAGGTQPITWSYTGDLPEGFMFTDSGTLFGIPTEEGKYKFRVTAENSQGSVSKSFTLKVLPQKPVITNAALPDGTAGSPYSFTLESEGDSIKWTKSGKFPSGLKLDKKTGEIYGTPKKAGTYTFNVKAKNKAGKDTAEFTMTINENPEGLSADLTQSVNSAALPENSSAHETDSISITELYLLRNGEEISDSAEVSPGMPLTFRAGELPDEDDSESKPAISGLKVFVNDEEIDGVKAASDGTFTIPAEIVNGKFTVYALGFADGEEFETSEIEIQAAGDSEGSSTESSGGCSINLAGMIMLLMSGIVLMKK